MVYLIYNKNNKTCKIGHSKNPKKRLIDLQVSSSDTLELLFTKEGGSFEESLLHEKYKDYLIRGEWFNYIPEMSIDFNGYKLNIEYVRFYYENIIEQKRFPSEREIELLSLLISKMKFATIDIYINTSLVKDLADKMNVTTRTIYNCIDSLIKKDFIYNPFQHKYLLNPNYVFNGPEDDRIKALNSIVKLYSELKNKEDIENLSLEIENK